MAEWGRSESSSGTLETKDKDEWIHKEEQTNKSETGIQDDSTAELDVGNEERTRDWWEYSWTQWPTTP